jgi:hypothetical protein
MYKSEKAKYMSYLTAGCQLQWRMYTILNSERADQLKREGNTPKRQKCFEYYKQLDIIREELCVNLNIKSLTANNLLNAVGIRTS